MHFLPVSNAFFFLTLLIVSSLDVDAVVNPANKGMNGGGGVDGMIHEKAGDRMLWECSHLYGVETGCTKATRAYRLPCRIVLHTVGPVGEDAVALKSCYETALSYLDGSTPLPYPASPIRSVAFCGISTGTYGYPLEAAAKIALETAREWLEKNHESVDRIIFCTWLAKEAATYEQVVPYYFPPASDSGALRHWAKAAANEIAAHLRRKPGLYPSDLEISLLDVRNLLLSMISNFFTQV
jgi:O-acetyl-ADP-ribose deacetylase (regulator of RNase III)